MKRIANSLICLSIASATTLFSSQLFAQEQGFGATTDIALGTESNIFRTDDETSDEFLMIAPKLGFQDLYGKHVFTLGYEGKYYQFNDASDLNYEDHIVGLKAIFDHSARLNTEFGLKVTDGVELPGLNNSLTTDTLEEFNQITKTEFEAKGIYGRRDSIGQIQLRYRRLDNEFDNNGQSFRDYVADSLTATFFYRIAPKTRLVFEASNRDLDYTNNINAASSTYRTYLVGAEWQATGKTSGIIKIGQQDQDFDNPALNDISGLAYFADVVWEANSFTEVRVGLSQQTSESSEAALGSFVQRDLTLNVEHEFTPRLSLDARYIYGEDDIVFSNNRTDKRHTLEVSLKHETTRLFDTSITFKNLQRDSNDARFEYSSNSIMIGIHGTFGKEV